ncbi:MAG: hypothetical protein ACOCVS_02135 [Planctomycetota bacterium]
MPVNDPPPLSDLLRGWLRRGRLGLSRPLIWIIGAQLIGTVMILALPHPETHDAIRAAGTAPLAPASDRATEATGAAHTPAPPTPRPPSRLPPIRSAPAAAAVLQPAAQIAPPTTQAPTSTPAATPPPPARLWSPTSREADRLRYDHPPMERQETVIVRVITIRAKVTAYTAYDHAATDPDWADGCVAWHAGGRKRRVEHHPYGIATDWVQLPAGITFVRVPGYMDQSFPDFPSCFRVVDDACGASRAARRGGGQPVIDLRYRTRYSAIDRKNGWGRRHLDVEALVPVDFAPDRSLRRWIIKDELHRYHDGELIDRSPFSTAAAARLLRR